MLQIKKIKIPAAGRNIDYKYKGGSTSSTSSSSSSSSSSIDLPPWLQFVEYDEENESIKFSKHLFTKDLNIEGQVNQWLAQQLVVEDARIQVNRKQEGVVVDSGLVIYDKDTSSEVSSLVYDVNGVWKAGGDRLFTEAYNPKLGGYAAGDYPRKSEAATIAGMWTFSRDIKLPTGSIDIGTRNGDGLRFRNSDSFKIYFSQSSDAALGGNLAGTADYNMYFRTSGGNRGWAFKYGDNIVAQIQEIGRAHV